MSIPKQIRQVFANARCVYTKQDIETALDRMAILIHQTLEHSNPVLLTVLKGGIVLTGNLLPRLDFPLEIDNVHASRWLGTLGRYSDLEEKGLEWFYEPRACLKDRTVLILDDILDLGITLQGIVDYCYEKGASKVLTGVLLDKKVKRPKNGVQQADFVALSVDDHYVFGYGLDYKEYLRNAPGIYEVAKEDQ